MMGWLQRWREARATKWTGGNPASPSYWVKKLFGVSNTTLSGVEINTDTALKLSAVWAAVNIISGAVGFLPMVTYRRLKPRGKERATGHPMYKLLHDRPNPYMDAATFREALQAHMLLWGNAYAEIERNGGGRAVALWPLLPDRTVPKIVNDKLVYEVIHKGVRTVLQYEDVLHLKGLGFDGIKGYSVVQYGAQNFGLAMAAERNASAFFGNDSSPTGILHTDDVLGKETKEQIEKDWEEKHKGSDKRYRIAILHSGLKWEQIGVPAKQAQLIESRKFSVTDIARWFSIAPHMIADLEKATFSNIEHQGIDFVVWTLQRWLKKWELETTHKLIGEGDYFVEFVVDGLLRGDTTTRYAAYNTGRNAGFLSVNDIREKENLNPVKGGDIYLEPLNMKPLGSPAQQKNFDRLIRETWRRIITREVGALRKMMQSIQPKRADFDEFYRGHEAFTRRLLLPVIEAYGNGIDGDTLVGTYLRGRVERVMESYQAGKLDTDLEVWEQEAADNETKRFWDILGGTDDEET